jgi:amicyanin
MMRAVPSAAQGELSTIWRRHAAVIHILSPFAVVSEGSRDVTHLEPVRRPVPGLVARRVAFAAALLVAAVLAAWAAPRTLAVETVSVQVVDFAYAPATLTVQVGDTVTWSNQDAVDHTVTTRPDAPAAFDGPLPPGGSYSFTFAQPGTYDYYCIPHPTMEGSIVVLPAAAPAASSSPGALPNATAPQPAAERPVLSVLGIGLVCLAGLLLVGPRLRGAAGRR